MSEREWREASDMQRSTATLAVIVIAAAALRFWSLGAGIPFAIGDDEPQVMNRSLAMVKTGDFNPRFYDYPGLYLYVQAGVIVVRFLAGATAGEWTSLAQVDSRDFYLWGRAVTAMLGTATVLLVYLIGMRWGTRHALLAAAMMAVMPMHVRESHFVLTDVPVTFFATLTFLLALRAHEHPRLTAYLLAGGAAGLAAATKYPGALALLLPLISVWMTPATRPSRLGGAAAIIVGAAAAFLLAAPYTLLDLPGFLNGYGTLMGSYTRRDLPEAPAITYYKHLRNALWSPGMVAVICGIVFAIVRAIRGPGRVRWTLAVTFPFVFYWFISQQRLVFGRYLLPAGAVRLHPRRDGDRFWRQPAPPVLDPAPAADGADYGIDGRCPAAAGLGVGQPESLAGVGHGRGRVHVDPARTSRKNRGSLSNRIA